MKDFDNENYTEMKLRNIVRECTYKSDWDLGSVIAECERQKIAPNKVVTAMSRLHSWCKVPAERLGGALAIVLLKVDRRINGRDNTECR